MAKEKNNKMTIICIIILAIVLLLAVAIPLTGLINDNEIAVIEINGEIGYLTNSTNNLSSSNIEAELNDANNNPNVKAIVIEVNSKNGSLIASEEISKIIENSKKPTVSWIGDYGLSEGYLIASSADTVVATQSSAIGGIGLSFKNTTKYSNKQISGKYVDSLANKSNYTMSDVNKNSFKTSSLLNSQEMLNQDYSHFVKLIADNRGLNAKYVSKIANAKVYNGNEALKLKLIDKIGDREKAIEIASEKAKIKEYTIVKYPQNPSTKLTTFLNNSFKNLYNEINKNIVKQ